MKTMIGFSLVISLLLALVASACAVDLTRWTVDEPGKLPGLYTAVLIGGTYAADAERVAIFDLEGDGYSFRPVTAAYNFKKIEGVTATAGVSEAVRHFASHCAYNGYRVKSLALADGAVVGYEFTPDYPPSLCEWGNTVTVSYAVGPDGEIKVYTNLLLPEDNGGRSFGSNDVQRK
jgi:hypothetical protein